MDPNPPNDPYAGQQQSQSGAQAQGQGPAGGYPPPPPPPYGYPPPGYGYPYGYWPKPPRKRTSFWKILLILLGLAALGFMALVVIGVMSVGMPRSSGSGFGDRLGLLRIEGIISQSDDKQFWIDSLKQFRENHSIKGIVVRIDSPGGTVGASQELFDAILKAREKKPVYISMGDLAASGGYYTASAANRIFANKGTLTGSIGVIFSEPNMTTLTQKLGIRTEVVKSGRFKDAGDPFRPMTAEERSLFDALIGNTYEQFVGDVLKNRKDPIAKAMGALAADQWTAYKFTRPAGAPTPEQFLKQIADGRVYTGEQALQLGLVDEIGTLDDTLQKLAQKVGVAPDQYSEAVRRHGLLEELFKSQVGDLLPSSRCPLQFMMRLP